MPPLLRRSHNPPCYPNPPRSYPRRRNRLSWRNWNASEPGSKPTTVSCRPKRPCPCAKVFGYPIKVYDEGGALIGDYYADLLVEGWLIVELKTTKALAEEHTAQVLGYLKSARLERGLLINLGSSKFQKS